ncbi:BRO family protein [uncultured Pseudomonas sp.]|uniref:BRO-N domain-containing protein n=1 Tax=uncultured Pseudomonas sp. TaxID=114707 RepID=UPI0030D77D34|tara:strand:- start:1269 stop:2081 length:813 start_codon:yes stop_codon:yes gene_type:complete
MSQPIEFAFDDKPVRVVLVDGEPWWIAADLAQALEYRIAGDMTRNLDDDEKGTQIVRTLGGVQDMLIINESGLYSAILRSRKASAKRFKKWVTAEVLPSIRRYGSYVMPRAEDSPEPAPMASRVEADEIVSAGRVFRSLYTVGRSMGMARRLAATRANQAAERATGVDLASELNASQWLDGPDMPEPQRRAYELQQRIRAHLVANDWPQGFSAQQLIEALGMVNDRGTQSAVGRCLRLLGYKRIRLSSTSPAGFRPYVYQLVTLPSLACG